jgi:hypothetical protein
VALRELSIALGLPCPLAFELLTVPLLPIRVRRAFLVWLPFIPGRQIVVINPA